MALHWRRRSSIQLYTININFVVGSFIWFILISLIWFCTDVFAKTLLLIVNYFSAYWLQLLLSWCGCPLCLCCSDFDFIHINRDRTGFFSNGWGRLWLPSGNVCIRAVIWHFSRTLWLAVEERLSNRSKQIKTCVFLEPLLKVCLVYQPEQFEYSAEDSFKRNPSNGVSSIWS